MNIRILPLVINWEHIKFQGTEWFLSKSPLKQMESLFLTYLQRLLWKGNHQKLSRFSGSLLHLQKMTDCISCDVVSCLYRRRCSDVHDISIRNNESWRLRQVILTFWQRRKPRTKVFITEDVVVPSTVDASKQEPIPNLSNRKDYLPTQNVKEELNKVA